MADIIGRVQGSIGSDEVNLVTNAATEATLSKLLQATLAIGTKNKEALEKLAKQFDLNSDSIENFNNQLDRAPAKFDQVYNRLERFEFVVGKISPMIQMVEVAMGKLASGTAQASDMFKSFGNTPVIGALLSRYGKLLAYQEENMKSYQQLTTAGINFAGNLGEIRESAANMYLTLDQFTKLMTENSDLFARFGIGANNGAVEFSKLAGNLQDSQLGTNLRALGYTAEELNNGMAQYIRNNGIRNRVDLQTADGQAALNQGTADYLENLQAVSRLTGESKEAQQKKINEVTSENAYQLELSRLRSQGEAGKKQADAMERVVEAARVQGREAMMAAQASVLNTQSTDKSVIQFQSAAQGSFQLIQQAAEAARQGMFNADDALNFQADLVIAGGNDFKKFGTVVQYALGGLKLLGEGFNTIGKNAVLTDGKSREEILAILKDRTKTEGTQAGQMARIQGDMFEATKAVTKAMQALVNDEMAFLEKSIHKFAKIVESVSDKIANNAGITNSVINSGLLTLGTVGTAINTKIAIEQYKLLKGMRPEASGSGEVSRIIDSTGKPFVKAAAAESEGVLASLSKTASKLAKPLFGIGTALTVGMAAGDYADIEKKRKQGLLSAEDAKTQKGGVVGGAAGGLGGAAAGAAAGGAIGTAFFGVGAIPGAIIGGMIGGFLGESAGKSIGENIATADKTTAAEEAKAKEEEQKKTEDIKTKSAGEILQASVDRLNTTMDKILTEMKNTSTNTEETAKGVKNNSYIKR
jgi:hypothetical protein